MKAKFLFDGAQEKVSKNGKKYSELFLKPVIEDGNVALEQVKFLSFNEDVQETCRHLAAGKLVSIDLKINDAVVTGLEEVYEL